MATALERQPVIPDLESFVISAFEGTNPDVNVGGAPNRDAAERMIVAAIAAKAPRALTAHEKGIVGMEVGLAWNRRLGERKAGLADIQQRLAMPARRMFAR